MLPKREGSGMVWLRRWMQVVGVVFVIIGVRLSPPLNEPFVPIAYPGLEVGPGSTAHGTIVDWMFTFGLGVVALGLLLLVASRDPLRHSIVVWAVVLHEVLAGIAAVVWFIARGHGLAIVYVGFIAFHAVVIVTGLIALRRARREGADSAYPQEHVKSPATSMS